MHEAAEEMLELARKARDNAYAPYSKYRVGVCIKSTNDHLYIGCNVENASYGLTQCAEATAIGNMITAGDHRIKEIVITSSGDLFCPPCGGCRQILSEFADPYVEIHLIKADNQAKSYTMAELLPESYGPHHLE